VSSTPELEQALAVAVPGQIITLADGNYRGAFNIDRSGKPNSKIWLCGSRNAVLTADSSQDVLRLGANDWVIAGFSLEGGLRGIMLERAKNNLLTNLSVRGTAQEAIHLRMFSSDNVIEHSEISQTGLAEPGFGEGIYLGSSQSQWAKFTGNAGTPDACDRNRVSDNVIGPDVRAEHIDIKEGTQGGLILRNRFFGAGISGANYADSWVDVKGNSYTIDGNVGESSPLDGFQVHQERAGWGNNNLFSNNTARVDAAGYGFSLSTDTSGNIVHCSNVASGARKGLANVACQPD